MTSFSLLWECSIHTKQASDDVVSPISSLLASQESWTARFLVCISLVDGFDKDLIGRFPDLLLIYSNFFLITLCGFSSLYCPSLFWYGSYVIANPPAVGLEVALTVQMYQECFSQTLCSFSSFFYNWFSHFFFLVFGYNLFTITSA